MILFKRIAMFLAMAVVLPAGGFYLLSRPKAFLWASGIFVAVTWCCYVWAMTGLIFWKRK